MEALPVHRVTMDTPYPIGSVNSYLILGEPLTLVDAGINTPQAQNALHMPGHSGGHVVFHEVSSGTMFAGDQLLPEVSPNPLLEPDPDEPGERRRSLKEYLGSLERMRGLGLNLAYPGHGDPVSDPDALIDSTIEHHLKRKVQVAGYLGAEPKTVYEVASEVYPDVKGYDIFLAVSEVVAHLDLVVEDGGAVAEAGENDVVFYRSAAANG